MGLTLFEFVVVLALMTALAVVMGRWLARSFSGEGHWAVERLSYRALGVDPASTAPRQRPVAVTG